MIRINFITYSVFPALLLFAVNNFYISCAIAQSSEASSNRSATQSGEALEDTNVQRCLSLGIRKKGKLEIEEAAHKLEIAILTDAVASCRAADAIMPANTKIIVARYLSEEYLSMIFFGLNLPDNQTVLFASAKATAESEIGFIGSAAAFFVASAYEYGLGTMADRQQAINWYRKAANAGEATSARELARLLK